MSVIEQLAQSAVMPYLTALADCLCEELTTNGAGPLCWCGVVPGLTVSLEYCETCSGDSPCGMGWVRVVTVTPTDVFPLPSLEPNCRRPLVWQVEAGAMRCMPVPANGEMVTAKPSHRPRENRRFRFTSIPGSYLVP